MTSKLMILKFEFSHLPQVKKSHKKKLKIIIKLEKFQKKKLFLKITKIIPSINCLKNNFSIENYYVNLKKLYINLSKTNNRALLQHFYLKSY